MIQLPLILAVIFAVTFTLVWVLPGNPLDRADGRRPPPEVEQAMKARYNLDSPGKFLVGYVKGAVIGDFGPSLQYKGQEVRDIIGDGLPISASLGLAALVVALFLGTLAGVLGALKPGSPLDSASLGVALLGISLPNFVTGTILLVVFAGVLRWVPVGGWESPRDMVLPAITLGLAPAAYIARLIRLGLADIMSADYIRTARAKGLSHTKTLFKHALKVAYLPVLSFLGPAAASVMTGSFVVEKVFNIPGIGEYFVNSVLNKDQSLILGIVLVYATMLILFNLVVDVAYTWLDPRIEL
ncbi:MAG: ABC transporter permease [Planctomycetota bacterium]